MARRRNTRRNTAENDDTLVDIVEVRDQAQGFVDKNQNLIFGALVGLVLLIGAVFFYNNYFKGPRLQEAADAMYQAQLQFEKDSFALALVNPAPGYDGFLGIIENYSGTPAANSAKYYAGICNLNLGEYQACIDYLNQFSPSGTVLPIMKYGAMGDCYSELGQMDKAISNYKSAANAGGSDVLAAYYLQKIAMWHEKNNDQAAANKAYTQIKEKYPTTPIGQDVERYITRTATAQ